MTSKFTKTRSKKARPRSKKIARIFAAVEDDLLGLAGQEPRAESRWNRPKKQRITLRIDCEVVDWFKSKGPGYQTRMTRILRYVMVGGRSARGRRSIA